MQIDVFSIYKLKETPDRIALKAYNQSAFEAYLLLRSVDQTKYGSLMKTPQTQHSLGKEQYLESIIKTVNVLSQHRWDKPTSNNNQRKSKNDNLRSDRNSNSVDRTSNRRDQNQSCSYNNNNNTNHSRTESRNNSTAPASSFAQQTT